MFEKVFLNISASDKLNTDENLESNQQKQKEVKTVQFEEKTVQFDNDNSGTFSSLIVY